MNICVLNSTTLNFRALVRIVRIFIFVIVFLALKIVFFLFFQISNAHNLKTINFREKSQEQWRRVTSGTVLEVLRHFWARPRSAKSLLGQKCYVTSEPQCINPSATSKTQ